MLKGLYFLLVILIIACLEFYRGFWIYQDASPMSFEGKFLSVHHRNKERHGRLKIAFKVPQNTTASSLFYASMVGSKNQLLKASRFEKNAAIRERLNTLIDSLHQFRLNDLNDAASTGIDLSLQEDVTFIFNCMNECVLHKLEGLLYNISKSYYWNQPIIITTSLKSLGLPQKLNLPFLQIVRLEPPKSYHDTYKTLLKHVKTSTILVTRQMTIFPQDTNLQEVISPIASSNRSDVVAVGSASTVHGRHQYELGCFQTKTLTYQHRIVKGYNNIDTDGYMLCDYITGAFVMHKDTLKQYLYHKSNSVKMLSTDPMHFAPEQFFTREIFYMDLFYFLQSQKRIVKIAPEVMLGQQITSIQIARVGKPELHPFMVKNQLSRFVLPTNEAFDFTCTEVHIPGRWFLLQTRTGMFVPKCLIDELSQVLLYSTQTFDKHGFHYELDSGSVMGQAKLSATLPWERDHDLSFRSRHFERLNNLSKTFAKSKYQLVPEFKDLEKCLRTKLVGCGYMGIKSNFWRIELWGQNALSSDFYRENENKTDTRLATSHVLGNVTRGQIGDKWVTTMNNPGAYARTRYGLNVLKHQQHWADTGGASSWTTYKVGRWPKCKTPGHHSCCSNYLADGNILYKSVWV